MVLFWACLRIFFTLPGFSLRVYGKLIGISIQSLTHALMPLVLMYTLILIFFCSDNLRLYLVHQHFFKEYSKLCCFLKKYPLPLI